MGKAMQEGDAVKVIYQHDLERRAVSTRILMGRLVFWNASSSS